MDDVVERYERANDLAKAGKNEEAFAEYKAGVALLQKSTAADSASRLGYFASKLSALLYKLQRYDEAKPYFEMLGQQMPKPQIKALGLKDAIQVAKKAGLMSELSDEELTRILDDLGIDFDEIDDDDELGLLEIVQSYYASESTDLSPRAVKDGFTSHDWRFGQETDDVVAELCQLIGKPIYRQIEYTDEPRTDVVGKTTYLHMESNTGERVKIKVDGLEDIVAFMNQALKKRGDDRRFVSCDTRGDWYAFFLVKPAAYELLFSGENPALPEDDALAEDTE